MHNFPVASILYYSLTQPSCTLQPLQQLLLQSHTGGGVAIASVAAEGKILRHVV